MKNAKKVLLVTKKNINFDTYISLQLLAEVIKQDLAKQVELAVDTELPRQFQTQFPLPDIKTLKSLPPKSFILEFKNQNSKVKNIQWNQSQEKLTLYLTMQQGNLNPNNLDIRVTGVDHDLILAVGINKLEELGTLYTNSKQFLDDTRIVVFGLKPEIKLPKVTVQPFSKSSSISEQIYSYLESNGVRLNPNRANRLLAGVFSATQNFRKNIRDGRTFEIAAKLTRYGATNEIATLAASGGRVTAGGQAAAKDAPKPKLPDQKASSQPAPVQPTTLESQMQATQVTPSDGSNSR